MLGVKVRKEGAEKIKKYLGRQKLMDINYRLVSANEFIYFPIESLVLCTGAFCRIKRLKIVEMKFDRIWYGSDRERLKKSLGKGIRGCNKKAMT